MPSSEIFQNPGAAHFIATIPGRHWAHAAPPASSQNRIIPLIWLQISPCAYAPRTRAKQKRTGAISFDEVLAVCPYRSLLGPIGYLHPDATPSASVAVLGFVPEDFSDEMRADILTY